MGFFSKKKDEPKPQPKREIGPEFFKHNSDMCISDFKELELDYTLESLQRLDGFVDSAWTKERFKGAIFGKSDNFDNMSFTNMCLCFGSYAGEVYVRNFGGQWKKSDQLGFWVVDIKGNEINIFHIAQDCFLEPSKYNTIGKIIQRDFMKWHTSNP